MHAIGTRLEFTTVKLVDYSQPTKFGKRSRKKQETTRRIFTKFALVINIDEVSMSDNVKVIESRVKINFRILKTKLNSPLDLDH